MGLASFAQRGSDGDTRRLAQLGIEPENPEALPYYARWTRDDVAALVYLVHRASIFVGLLFVALAVPLWMLALR